MLLASAATDSFEKTVLFMIELMTMLMDYMRTANDRSAKVVDFKQPHELRQLMDQCLQIHNEPQSLEQLLSDCKQTLKYCVKTGQIITYYTIITLQSSTSFLATKYSRL